MARSFLSSVLSVAGGTAIAQAIGIAALPVITRLYPPEVYGAYVLLLAYGGVVAPVVCARYEVALALPRRAQSAGALAWGAMAIALCVAAVCALVVAALVLWGVADVVLVFLPVYVLLAGALQVLSGWCMRQRAFDRLSLSRVAQAAVTAALAVGLGLGLGSSAAWLVCAVVAGQVVALVLLLARLEGRGLISQARPRQAWRLLRHFRRVAVFNVPHVLSDSAQSSGLPLAIAAVWGTPAAAYYAFSLRLLKAPLGLVGSAISQVFYPRAAAHRNDDAQLRDDARRLLTWLVPGALLALPVLMLVPDAVYTWAFGPAWHEVGRYLRALTPWALSSFVIAPLAVLYVVKQRFALDFALGLAGSAVAFATLLVAWWLDAGTQATILALSLSMTVYVLASAVCEFAVVIGWGRRRA